MRFFHELATPVGTLKFVKQKRNPCSNSELFSFSEEQANMASQSNYIIRFIILICDCYSAPFVVGYSITENVPILSPLAIFTGYLSCFWAAPEISFFYIFIYFPVPTYSLVRACRTIRPSGNRQINGYVHCAVIRTFV